MDTIDPEKNDLRTEARTYTRAAEVDEETFEGDLLLMHRSLMTVVTLNAAAAVLWEALQWPLTADDLAGLLTEAHPELPAESALAKVNETLALLEEYGFVAPAGR